VPGFRLGKEYRPSLSVWMVELICRSVELTVTDALGTKAPDGSVTWPAKLAF
jgi:hypothetical protein